MIKPLKIDWLTITPPGEDGARTAARSKGKIEYPFRTVKETHETLTTGAMAGKYPPLRRGRYVLQGTFGFVIGLFNGHAGI